ncbi:SRPBCC domain-containing protein [Streptacidiphilus sp. PB12-B1b]|uniref:SRPBCC domain-containing protein n=1 Tax=Streptacidiphilus sp. PB12-B1b TaxID=2705012 RepID=UPI0015FDBC56|nr:SRPBCC domain-containing protein [Streptacidiphilus sp. PB12-B1b]QMU78122.1 SRPBCC domain-containing protein [Streptacidiphilus sp. PB12-B1b]
MLEIAASIQITGPPEAVWAVLADLPGYPQWNPFIRKATGELVVGGKLNCRIHPENAPSLSFKPVVLTVEPGRELCWRGMLLAPGIMDGTHRFVLEANDRGTLLKQSEVFTGLLTTLLGTPLRAVRKDFERLNEALRKRVEAGSPATTPA